MSLGVNEGEMCLGNIKHVFHDYPFMRCSRYVADFLIQFTYKIL